MNNFNFYNPTHIIFGRDRLGELNDFVPKGQKVLILYGGGSVKKYGALDKVKTALQRYEIFEFAGIEPNPHFSTLMKAVELIKKENIQFMLALGGGSVIDGTKFISLATGYDGNCEDLLHYYGKALPVRSALPFGTVLTLPATASEMNSGSVISHGHSKYIVKSPLAFPRFSFLCPELTFSLPPRQIANGIVDAFVHTTEQYLTFPVDAKFQDRTAEGILKSLIETGPVTLREPENYDARANMMWLATMALNGLIGAGVPQDWSTHLIGHELTAHFGIDHGQSLAIVLPRLLRMLKADKLSKLVQYAERVWNIKAGSNTEKADKAIEHTSSFFRSLGIKIHLSDYGVKAEELEKVSKGLIEKNLIAISETKKVTPELSIEILRDCI